MLTFKRSLFLGLATSCFLPAINAPIALTMGLVFRNFVGDVGFPQVPKITKRLLQVAVVMLGFCIEIDKAIAAGSEGFTLTSLSVFAVLGLGFLLTKRFHLDRKLSFLISSGTAICGGSAIASMAPVINASTREISSALAVVFVLNAVAVFIFPSLGAFMHMTQHQFGLWCAVAIHDTSSVVGAASVYGKEALELATTAKLVRVLWIIPLMLGMAIFNKDKKEFKFPWFVVFFIVAMGFSAFFPLSKVLSVHVFDFSKSLMSLVLFLMGTSLTLKEFKTVGYKPLVYGIALWVFVGVASAALILAFY
ncbi:YeiH family protein [Roseivirga sp.]|uniref:YeiH family protein n=1 Tax=Roseivirga sp. TaxID=1964215 RepID=UPI002B268C1A|nr:putative sulfate exporter family transporter [Roseivirga sp.]